MSDPMGYVFLAAGLGVVAVAAMLVARNSFAKFILLVVAVVLFGCAYIAYQPVAEQQRILQLAQEKTQAEIGLIQAQTEKIQAEVIGVQADTDIKHEGLTWMKSFRYGMTLTTLWEWLNKLFLPAVIFMLLLGAFLYFGGRKS